MKRVLHFATKLNSRDIKKCDCLWVPSVICSSLLAKQYFPRLRQLAFTDWETRSRLCLLSDWWQEVWGKSNLPQKVQQSFLNQNLDLPPFPPPLIKRSWIRPLQRCYTEIGANEGLCWRVQVNQFFFELYIIVSLVARKTQYNFINVIWKLCLIIGILEEQETYLLRAFLIIQFTEVRWFLVLRNPD